jgi:outer membrane protein assembly factor BamB
VLKSLLAGLGSSDDDDLQVIPTRNGYLQFGSQLVERRTVARKVMKDPPKKSALDGPVNQAATMAIANEILNDMTRDSVGDTIEEDESRYRATLRRPGAPDWTGEVIGHPGLIPVDTVDLVTSRKAVIVLDKSNKKLWEAKLASDIHGGHFDGESAFGAGPAVERGDTLYLFDTAVLTAFDRATGNARWRLPSVGIAGLFFDDKGMLYVNTSTASPDSLRYSRQIDVSQKTHTLVMKVDPKTGKTLWRTENDGLVTYVSGKYIYTLESSQGEDGGMLSGMKLASSIPPHIRIKRLKPSNGRVLWEHYQMRAPLDYHFDQNEIQILFRKELQVLRFMSL